MLTVLVTEVYFTLLVLSVAAGQILHVVRVCVTDVPVTHTSPTVVQIPLQLLSNWTTVCSLHHCHLSHDKGGWGCGDTCLNVDTIGTTVLMCPAH